MLYISNPKLWHSNDKYRRTIWQCNNKFKNKCNTPHITEDEIKSKYLEALSLLLKNKDEVINNLTQIANSLLSNTYEQELKAAKKRVNDLYELCKIYMANNDIKKIKEIVAEYNCAYDIYTAYLIEHKDKISRKASLESFINTLKETDELNLTFSNKLFIMTIDRIIVNGDYLEFCFKDGEIVRIEI